MSHSSKIEPTPKTASAPTRDKAFFALTDFQQSSAKGVWPHLDKGKIVMEMRSRLKNPFTVNQGQQPFCGPASILFELIQKFPIRYVKLCQDLYENGGFQAQTQRIEASAALRQASQGNLRMGPADWMVLSTLRESENLIFPVEPNSPDIIRNMAGMTKSWEIKGWVKEILGYSNAQYRHTYLLRDLKTLQNAQEVIDQGGVAFALITAKGLLDKTAPTVTVPNHWVTITGNVNITKGRLGRHDSGHVNFDVFTWARKMHVDVNEGRFEDSFWGVVFGWNE